MSITFKPVEVQVVPVRIRRDGKRVTVKRVSIYAGDEGEVLTTPEARDLIADLQAAIAEAEGTS